MPLFFNLNQISPHPFKLKNPPPQSPSKGGRLVPPQSQHQHQSNPQCQTIYYF